MSFWTTRADELVGVGDLVALSVLAHPDAVGRIVGAADDGKVQCLLVRGSNAKAGTVVRLDTDQLLVRVLS